MQKLKRFLLYILLVVVLALIAGAALKGLVSDCLSSTFGDAGSVSYFRASTGTRGGVYAVGARSDELILVAGADDGTREFTARLPELAGVASYTPDSVFSCEGGGYMMSVYARDGAGDVQSLVVFYADPRAEGLCMLVNRECSGSGDAEREKSVRVSSFGEFRGSVSFLVWEDGVCDVYSYVPGTTALLAADRFDYENAFTSAAVLSDGTALFCDSGAVLRSSGGREFELNEGSLALRLWPAEDGAYLLDGATGVLKRFNPTDMTVTDVFEIESATVVDLNVAADGGASVLTGEGELLLCRDGEAVDISGAFYRQAWASVLILAALAIAVLFVAYALWYLLCEFRRMKISMILRKGALLAVLLALGLTCALNFAVRPYMERTAENEAEAVMSAAAAMLREREETDAEALEAMSAYLTSAGEVYGSAELYTFSFDGERFMTQTSSAGIGGGVDARFLLCGEEFARALDDARTGGAGSAVFGRDGTDYYMSAIKLGANSVLAVTIDGAPLIRETAEGFHTLAIAVYAAGFIVFTVVVLMLLQTRLAIRRVAKGMDTVSAGNTNVEVVERGGDETEALADSFNTLARSLRFAAVGSSRRSDSLMRFVPQQIITLLGANSIENVDKNSFSSKYLATMSIHFSFDERVYESRSRELFDNINEVIERTAGIIPQNGGTVYDFSHDGYDALFDADSAACVSAAVAIREEVIALNRDRGKTGLSPVELHIALDMGDVMMGIVGDETRMQATAISASFNTTRMLTTLFSRFEANILCTEEVINLAEGYGSRYIGKTRDGDEMIRVYEIFDGDAYGARVGKAATARDFSDGVYTLYSRDFSAAKRIFMDIARKNPADGVAKFYLYLADRFEKDAPEDISLDY